MGIRVSVGSLVCLAALAQLLGAWLLTRNPVFFDHLGLTVLFLFLVPGCLGLILGQIFGLVVSRHSFSTSVRLKRRTGFLFVAAAVPLASCFLLWLVSHAAAARQLGPSAPQLLVVGLDGATWEIIDPMVANGQLPTLARLCSEGSRGTLESLSPIRSPAVWTTIATGREPGDHGITGYYQTRTDLRCARIWDVANAHGKRVGLFRWLVTWPPDSRFEFTIPAWLARSPETWPQEYEFMQEVNLDQDETGRLPGLGVLGAGIVRGFRIKTAVSLLRSWRHRPADVQDAYIARHMRSVQPSVDVFLHLIRKCRPDVAAICFYGSDQLAHHFWKYFDPEPFGEVDPDLQKRYGQVIPDYYRLVDRALGRIISMMPETTVVVVSDHGMGPDLADPARYVFRMDRILDCAGLGGWFTVTFVQRRYILYPSKPLTEADLEIARNRLEEIHLYENEYRVFQVELEEDGTLILNPRMGLIAERGSPLQKATGLVVNGRIMAIQQAVEVRHLSGKHEPNGIFLLKGLAIRTQTTIKGATVFDIAPTLLFLLGLPVSREMPGRVLEEAFRDDFLAEHPVRWVDSFQPPPPVESRPGGDRVLTERLRALGYIE